MIKEPVVGEWYWVYCGYDRPCKGRVLVYLPGAIVAVVSRERGPNDVQVLSVEHLYATRDDSLRPSAAKRVEEAEKEVARQVWNVQAFRKDLRAARRELKAAKASLEKLGTES